MQARLEEELEKMVWNELMIPYCVFSKSAIFHWSERKVVVLFGLYTFQVDYEESEQEKGLRCEVCLSKVQRIYESFTRIND